MNSLRHPSAVGRFLAATVIAVALLSASPAAVPAKVPKVLATFDTPGTYSWTVPTGVRSVTFNVFGASGGDGLDGIGRGGPGGQTTATFEVRRGQTFQIVVGERGGHPEEGLFGLGGFNGGGNGGAVNAGGGGGASDVRLGGSDDECAVQLICGPQDRIMVAGGGGGGALLDQSGYDGGAGGGFVGEAGLPDCVNCAGGNGGFHYLGTGSLLFFGRGTAGLNFGSTSGSGGGGGGWFGGQGGQTGNPVGGGAGGGGSGHYSGWATSGAFPGGQQVGDGVVTISTP